VSGIGEDGDPAGTGAVRGSSGTAGGDPFRRPVPEIPQAALHWDRRYAADERIWGDGPSELARLAVARLRPYASPELSILDVGCAYGRDSRYLAAELGCRVLGLDPSPAAVAAARKARSPGLEVEYVAGDLGSLASDPDHAGPYDVVFVCNVYHLLGPIGRREFAAALAAAARPGGLLFLSTLSPRDPQHYAVGEPVSGEERSWVDRVYLHFVTAEELTRDFAAFDVLDLEERSYDEAQANGQVHHHASWFLEGRRRRSVG
jgi:2-polyprenyl-3-methyl-5-hydroxy-6-metoxy-1,4-benzoquinol methylase